MPRSASFQFCTTTYSSSSCRNSSVAFSKAGSTSTKSASTPAGLKLFGFAVLDRRKETLYAFGRICAMRKDFFERILARFESRGFGAQMIQILPRFGGMRLANAQFLFHAPLAVGRGFQLHLPRRHLLRQIRLHRLQPLQIAGSDLLFTLAARRIALDGRQDIRSICAS